MQKRQTIIKVYVVTDGDGFEIDMNGIAFINLQVQCLSPSDGFYLFITGLPPSAIPLYFEVKLNDDTNKLLALINRSGLLMLSGGTQNSVYRIAFSYPIDD